MSYIRREVVHELIRDLKKYRWTSPTSIESFETVNSEALQELIDVIPTADAVEVVRCKDCKHLEIINSKEIYARCRMTDLEFKPFDIDARKHYCSYGERREENATS